MAVLIAKVTMIIKHYSDYDKGHNKSGDIWTPSPLKSMYTHFPLKHNIGNDCDDTNDKINNIDHICNCENIN